VQVVLVEFVAGGSVIICSGSDAEHLTLVSAPGSKLVKETAMVLSKGPLPDDGEAVIVQEEGRQSALPVGGVQEPQAAGSPLQGFAQVLEKMPNKAEFGPQLEFVKGADPQGLQFRLLFSVHAPRAPQT
jgi:hypothetical protein